MQTHFKHRHPCFVKRVSSQHYSHKCEVPLAVDTSPFGLGAVISHMTEDGAERPIVYASRSLMKAGRNYLVLE